MNGDGNNNAADAYEIGSGSGKISGTAGTLTYSALLEFWSKFDPYSMNTMLVSNDVMLQMLKLSEFQNPLTGLNFQGTGTLSTPLGAKLLRTSAVPAGKLIGLDKNYALEHICGSEVMVSTTSSSTARSSARRSRAFRALPSPIRRPPRC